METVSNLASQASSYLFGDSQSYDPANQSGQEPRSGETGYVQSGEPYDAGNKDEPGVDNQGTTNAYPSKSEDNTNNYTTSGTSNANNNDNNLSSSNAKSSNTDSSSSNNNLSSNANPSSTDSNSNSNKMSSNSNSSSTKQPSSQQEPQSDIQYDDHNETKSIPKCKGSSRPIINARGVEVEPDPSSGSRALQQQQNGETPGELPENLKKYSPSGGAESGSGSGSGVGSADGEKPHSESQGEGTGEKYVKSTGLKADGGDFDAANAGAGREADRLLEEKGIHHGEERGSEERGSHESEGGRSSSQDSGEKNGKLKLKEKIKSKLHRH
jgi:hypothetical protein